MTTVDRFKEYQILIEDTAKLSDRRQTINDILVGINALFLTGLGYIIVNSRLTTWWIPEVLGVVALVTLPINFTWRALNERYRKLVGIRIDYLTKLETKLRSTSGENDFGVYHEEFATLYSKSDKTAGFSQLERRFIILFTLLYPGIAIAMAVVSYFVQQHMLPPVKWN